MRVLKVKIHRPSYYNCVIFAFCFTEILFSTTLETIFGVPTEWLNKMMAYLMLVLLLIQIVFFQKYKRSELIKIVCAGVPFVISALMSKNNSLLCAFLFITAGKDADMDRIVKMLYKLSIIIITAIALLSLTGVIGDRIVFRGNIPRHSLGFEHPNTLGQRIFILFACHFYLRFDRIKWWDYLLAIGGTVFCYIVPNSQTAIVMLVIMCICTVILKAAQKVDKQVAVGKGMIICSLGLNFMSIVLGFIDLRKIPFLYGLDLLLHGRFSACGTVFELYGIPLFGQKVIVAQTAERAQLGIPTWMQLYLDNAYCSMLVMYGIVAYLLFTVFYTMNMNKQLKDAQYKMVFILFLISVYGLMEKTLFIMTFNVFLLSASSLIYGQDKNGLCPERSTA